MWQAGWRRRSNSIRAAEAAQFPFLCLGRLGEGAAQSSCPTRPARPQLVLSEISGSSPVALQAVKQLALYLKDEGARGAVVEQVAEWLGDMNYTNNATVLLVAGLVYLLEENYVEALKCCHSGQSLEM